MHAALITIMLSTNIGYGQVPGEYDRDLSPAQYFSETDGMVDGYGGVYPPDAKFGHGALYAKFGPMPQTCYEPRYGCYPGNARCLHRYPAFHGCFYRHPYNYRQYFDYPWNAGLHEPTSLFSSNVVLEGVEHEAPSVAPEQVMPPSASRRTKARPAKTVSRKIIPRRIFHRRPLAKRRQTVPNR